MAIVSIECTHPTPSTEKALAAALEVAKGIEALIRKVEADFPNCRVSGNISFARPVQDCYKADRDTCEVKVRVHERGHLSDPVVTAQFPHETFSS